MKPIRLSGNQRGAVLITGLIMLVLVTLTVTMAFKFSTTNLKAVGNMQTRNEAVAAANKAVEQVVGAWDFSTAPAADEINVDIDNNGAPDYVVKVAPPVCIKATPTTAAGDAGSDCTTNLDGTTVCASTAATSVYAVVWDVDATATGKGTSVRVHQGISRTISQAQCNAACPPAPGTPCV
jgi:Tfp pilus assembly protein PilX